MADRASADAARDVVARAITSRIFPAAVAEVGDRSGLIWREAFGRLTFDETASPTTGATVFDLASLTKPIVTTSLIMQLEAARRVDLLEPIASAFDEWRGHDRESTTVQDLLEHSAGLAARLIDRPPEGRREFEHEICVMRLEYAPRTKSLYSDLGFILLGFLAEDRGSGSLAEQFERITVRLKPDTTETTKSDAADHEPATTETTLAFDIPPDARARTAPTRALDEDARRGELLVGKVHDNYAAALGGVAGHAGLFGTAAGVGAFARLMLRGARGDNTLPAPFSPALIARMTRKSAVPGSSRALGWDTMLPTSSCGAGMSPAAFGHVGYTGTSLWIDPILDRYFVLLANRACGGGSLEQMRDVRRAFHDAVVTMD